jgi:hypothetical protein
LKPRNWLLEEEVPRVFNFVFDVLKGQGYSDEEAEERAAHYIVATLNIIYRELKKE